MNMQIELCPRLHELPVNTLITFGKFKINNTESLEDIIWRIVAKNHPNYPSDSVTLVSENIIEYMPFMNMETEKLNNYYDSGIRKWLNGRFFADFNPNHISDIIPTDISGVQDFAFLLSEDDLSLFECNSNKFAKPTNQLKNYMLHYYGTRNLDKVNNYIPYWLRTADSISEYFVSIMPRSFDKELSEVKPVNQHVKNFSGVRPVLNVTGKTIVFTNKDGLYEVIW